MATSDKQRELDAIKWEKSQMLGMDACGTFDYCAYCDKNKANPCEEAFNLTYAVKVEEPVEKPVKKTTTAKSTTKKSTCDKKCTSAKKAPAKKTTTKKTTTKKSK
jgi:hypothetical protein